jgi:hypothetical protein
MSIEIRDPLALLPHQAGLVVAPLQEQAAEGQVDLAVRQKTVVIGEPVPIIFCLRASSNGGVLVSPGASEGRFENAAVTNTLTMNLELVLTEGNLVDSLTPSQLYQGNCRQGTWLRSYNRRAGSWTPGNAITAVSGTTYWNCPVECGTSGNYEDLTTLSFTNTYLDGDDTWSNQIHCFINSGISVPRILVGTNGASSNVVDLALYLIRESSRYTESLLDLTAMTQAATFTNYNSFFYQGVYHKSSNLEDWLEEISISFLLRVTDKNGKKGLRPRLPFNVNGSINTSALTWVYGFTEEDVLPDGFEIEYIPLTDRQSICVQVLWRQQPQNYAGLMRTLEVRYTGEASTGPFEQYDLSDFCTNESHAVKVGVYHAARRKYITHTLRLHVRPGSYNSTLTQGDVVRVRLQRETSEDQISLHDYLYEVERIDRRFNGSVILDLVHLPVDSQGRSIVAVAVNSATAPGYSYTTGPYTLACSVNAGNTTPITDSGGNLPGLPANSNFEYNITAIDEAQPQGAIDNPIDPFSIAGIGTSAAGSIAGTTLTAPTACAGATYQWKKNGSNISGATASTYEIQPLDVGDNITVQITCPDGSTVTPAPVLTGARHLAWTANISATIYYKFSNYVKRVRCSDGVTTTDNLYTSTGSVGRSNFNNLKIFTRDLNTGDYDSQAISYSMGCGRTSLFLCSRNGVLFTYNNNVPSTYDLWGGSTYANTDSSWTLIHSTIVTAVVLTANVPGIGVIGDDVTQLGYFVPDGQSYPPLIVKDEIIQ